MLERRAGSTLALTFALAVLSSCGGSQGSGSDSTSPTKTTPTITWSTPAAITYGTALSTTQLDATASVAGTFVYTPAAGTIPLAGSQTLSVTFMPSDTTDYNSASDSVTLTVNGNLGQAVSLFGAITQVDLNSGDANQDPAQITLPDGKVEIMWIRSGAVYTSLCVVATGDITATCSSPALASITLPGGYTAPYYVSLYLIPSGTEAGLVFMTISLDNTSSGYSYPYYAIGTIGGGRCDYIFFTSTHPDQWAELLLGLHARRADIRHDIGCCCMVRETPSGGTYHGHPYFFRGCNRHLLFRLDFFFDRR